MSRISFWCGLGTAKRSAGASNLKGHEIRGVRSMPDDSRSRCGDRKPAGHLREVRFTGASAMDALCACLLDARRSAETQGRLDFTAEVELAGTDAAVDVTARIWMGLAHGVGRINFAGHTRISDSTLRRTMTVYERDMLDIGELRRSLARINDIGVFEPLTLADIGVVRRDDGVTADLTITLRERKRRWWSVSGPVVPGIGAARLTRVATATVESGFEATCTWYRST